MTSELFTEIEDSVQKAKCLKDLVLMYSKICLEKNKFNFAFISPPKLLWCLYILFEILVKAKISLFSVLVCVSLAVYIANAASVVYSCGENQNLEGIGLTTKIQITAAIKMLIKSSSKWVPLRVFSLSCCYDYKLPSIVYWYL